MQLYGHEPHERAMTDQGCCEGLLMDHTIDLIVQSDLACYGEKGDG